MAETAEKTPTQLRQLIAKAMREGHHEDVVMYERELIALEKKNNG